jgi:hypothetical protein
VAGQILQGEQRSKALFGNKHMLELCDGIARSGDRFTALELSATAGVGYSTTHRLLGSLVKVGLVARAPRSAGEREQWYVRQRHRFWDAMTDLHEDAGAGGDNSAE